MVASLYSKFEIHLFDILILPMFFFKVQVQDPDGVLTRSNRKIECDHSSQHICADPAPCPRNPLNQSGDVGARGGVSAPPRFQVIKQPEIN